MDVAINFCEQMLNFKMNGFDLNNVYRIGTNRGKRPILISFIQNSMKQKLMSNIFMLKGKPYSISDDLTPEARTERKLLLKCAKEARDENFNVKVKRNGITVNDTFISSNDLSKTNWLERFKLQPIVTVSNPGSSHTVSQQGTSQQTLTQQQQRLRSSTSFSFNFTRPDTSGNSESPLLVVGGRDRGLARTLRSNSVSMNQTKQ
jgi:hypothetical protein